MIDYNKSEEDIRGLWRHGEKLYSIDSEGIKKDSLIIHVVEVSTGNEWEGPLLFHLKRVMSTSTYKHLDLYRSPEGKITIGRLSEKMYNYYTTTVQVHSKYIECL